MFVNDDSSLCLVLTVRQAFYLHTSFSSHTHTHTKNHEVGIFSILQMAKLKL